MLQGQLFLAPFNYTDIVLIHKHVHPYNPADFRPINFCNTIYKIVTTVLTERLTKILPTIISKNQGAFLKNTKVSDIALIDQEIINHIAKPTKLKAQQQNIALKIDLSKAYDKIEWSYLISILQKFNFPPQI